MRSSPFGKLLVGGTRISFRKLGLLLKSRGIVTKNRVPLWEIALGLVLNQLGLSFRKTAWVLGRLGKDVSHVAAESVMDDE